jgi:hypothetical protein
MSRARRTRTPPATGRFAEALNAGRRIGAANAPDDQLMAMFCYDTLQLLVGAFSPQLVWEGAQRAGLTTAQLAKLCADRDLAALDDLQWSE